jgi:hypothetical protein
MKDSNEQQPLIAKELGKYRLAAPSAELRDRILLAARQAMTTREAESEYVSWTGPALRFAACMAIAVVLILTGTMAGNFVSTQRQSPSPSERQILEMNYIAEFTDDPILFRLAATAFHSEKANLQNILIYQRQIQELLNGSD